MKSHVFLVNQNQNDANSPIPSMAVPKGETANKRIFSSSQVSHERTGKRIIAISSFDSTVVICVEHGDQETYYTFSVTGCIEDQIPFLFLKKER